METPRPEAVALISGGKDSLLALYHAIANGYNVVALANLHPPITTTSNVPTSCSTDATGTSIYEPSTTSSLGPAALKSDELDSYMYQTIGHTLLPLYAQCLGLPLYRREIAGGTVNTQLDYGFSKGSGDETEDLTLLLSSVRARHPNVIAVTSGAILSTYQRTRIESVCARLGLTSLAYLWRMEQEEVLAQLATLGFDAKIVKVAALGLDDAWLWRNVADPEVVARLGALKSRWGINPAGEGGEYETLVVSAPGWTGRIVVPEEARVVNSEGGGAAWVGFSEASVQPVEGGERRQEEWAEALQQPSILDPEFESLLETLPTPSVPIVPPQTFQETSDDTPLLPITTTTATILHIANLVSPSANTSLIDELHEVFTTLTSLIAPHPLTAITSITLLLRHMSDFATINSAYTTYFPLPLPPSRVCISVPGLPASRNIMLSATLSLSPSPRKGLHVQSRSYWAPANIGPYSQAVLSSGWWEVAGQIPLVPAEMSLHPASDVRGQCVLALQHLHKIWDAVGAAETLAAIAWVVDEATLPTVAAAWKAHCPARPLMVLQATELPRGAAVEWVGFASAAEEEDEDGTVKREVEMVFADAETVGESVRKLALQVGGGGNDVVTVYLPVATGSVQAFLGAWSGRGGQVGVVPVAAVWDAAGMRRGVGCVIRRG
ncbi:hypothetical protein BZA05DRAFT_67363 [Tricharina praecox]|uniref:uncharacterized protein n=1 Tax=Tricharina praecox TaxID=43433 RepID=UPI0022200DAA|nr:uncharacterized protein BZA05DRAFT_67363 [Tricharina praecox]KAI5850047.1 hypothetical protein BZA05DRAFT_67363 [Tricharina praecox]